MELEEWKINHADRPAGSARSGLFYRYRYQSEKNLTGYNYGLDSFRDSIIVWNFWDTIFLWIKDE